MNFQVQQFFGQLDQTLNQVLTNPYVTASVSLFVILYAGLAAPQLPAKIAGLFDYTLFKMLVLTVILLINNYNPTVAILVAVAFFLSLQTLSRYRLYDMAREVVTLGGLLGGQDQAEAEAEADMVAPDSKYGYGPRAVMDYNEGPLMESQVSGLAGRSQDFMGPQGLDMPIGYQGNVIGAALQ